MIVCVFQMFVECGEVFEDWFVKVVEKYDFFNVNVGVFGNVGGDV